MEDINTENKYMSSKKVRRADIKIYRPGCLNKQKIVKNEHISTESQGSLCVENNESEVVKIKCKEANKKKHKENVVLNIEKDNTQVATEVRLQDLDRHTSIVVQTPQQNLFDEEIQVLENKQNAESVSKHYLDVEAHVSAPNKPNCPIQSKLTSSPNKPDSSNQSKLSPMQNLLKVKDGHCVENLTSEMKNVNLNPVIQKEAKPSIKVESLQVLVTQIKDDNSKSKARKGKNTVGNRSEIGENKQVNTKKRLSVNARKYKDRRHVNTNNKQKSPKPEKGSINAVINNNTKKGDLNYKRGLIQLSSSFGERIALENSPKTDISKTIQKHLFNPNNPSKPLIVIPSARDAAHDTLFASNSHGVDHSEQSWNSNVPDSRHDRVDTTVIYGIQKGELDISYYVSSNQLAVEFPRIMSIRTHLQACYRQLMYSNIRYCVENNIEVSLWKSLYYVIIEKLREYISASNSPENRERSLGTLLMLINEGNNYFLDLLKGLEQSYLFVLEEYLEEDLMTKHCSNKVKAALITSQKLLLYLGDLARWYQMALQVCPRNGRPFNQLAIIAVNQKRSLDVVYYYVRSLTAANPFTSARDSLISMFDDVRKKYEGKEKCIAKGRAKEKEKDAKIQLKHQGLRQEIWIRPDSGVTNCRTLSDSNDDDLKQQMLDELRHLPPDQLMKRFLASYLHCHGMLFSRVGLDVFHGVALNMLREFYVLLRLQPARLSTNHLLQIFVINMFAISNTQIRDPVMGSGYRSAAQELALVLAQEMFGRLVEWVVELFPHHFHTHPLAHHTLSSNKADDHGVDDVPVAADPNRLFMPALAHFIPSVKVWCDWLLYHSSVWSPPPDSRDYSVTQTDAWPSVAELATILRGIGTPDVYLSEDPEEGSGFVPVRLPEDNFLRGYDTLAPAHRTVTLTKEHTHMGRASDWLRITQLQMCLCQFLCGVDPPVLRLQKTEKGDILVACLNTTPPDTPSRSKESVSGTQSDSLKSISDSEVGLSSDSDDENLGLFSSDLEGADEDTTLASTVRLLAHQKKVLEKKHKQQMLLQSLVEGSVTLEMSVKPRFLVPDTNCFIENLEMIQNLVTSSSYTVMVPIVVLNELDGLSRDAAVEKYGSVAHAVHVKERASSALAYLHSIRSPSLKCITSQGSVLSSTTFTAEMDLLDASTNDDKILSCCLHFCNEKSHKELTKDGVRHLYREVVLLTEDRNLRVKAHARDVPVRDLVDFIHWAGVK